MILRPYQTKAIYSIGEIFTSGKKRAVLYSPTGSGKTEIGMEVIRRALVLRKKIIFICNRIELVHQTSRRIAKDDIPHGIIQGSNTDTNNEPVQICSIQTLDRRGYPEADILMIDEAHGTAGSKAYLRLMEYYKEKLIVGLTATPFAKGMAKTYAWGMMWEGLAVAATIKELITAGYLVDCDIYAPGEPDLSKVKITAGDYNEKQLGVAVDKQELIGDIVLHWTKLANNKPTVCFATNIAHSKHIVEKFLSVGITAEHIDCYTNDSDRKEILARVDSGKTKIISCVSILAEGWDQPSVEVMILARPTRSLIRYIQMSGRILRPFEGKLIATILDHSGTCRRLGFPTDDLPLMLDDGKPRSAAQKKKDEEAQKEKLPIICKRCSVVLSPKMSTCPRCGWEVPRRPNKIIEGEGELKLVKRNGQKIVDMPTEQREKVYSEFLYYARSKGFKDGWAWWKCKELFGSAPRERRAPSPPTEITLKLIKYLNIKRASQLDKSQ